MDSLITGVGVSAKEYSNVQKTRVTLSLSQATRTHTGPLDANGNQTYIWEWLANVPPFTRNAKAWRLHGAYGCLPMVLPNGAVGINFPYGNGINCRLNVGEYGTEFENRSSYKFPDGSYSNCFIPFNLEATFVIADNNTACITYNGATEDFLPLTTNPIQRIRFYYLLPTNLQPPFYKNNLATRGYPQQFSYDLTLELEFLEVSSLGTNTTTAQTFSK